MNKITAKAIMFLGLVSAVSMAQAHVEPGSFLNRPAYTTEQLVHQVESDREVMQRYERHFRMTGPEVVQFFSTLHPGTMEQAGSYIVYNVHDDNVIRARVFQLKRGTPLFVDPAGKPVLKRSCGNPMIAPTPTVPLNVQATPTQPSLREVAREETTAELMPPTENLTPEFTPAPPPVAPVVPVAPTYTAGNVGGGGGFFFLPLLLIFNSHGSSCCCTTCPPQTVPEPASMAVMGIGASLLAIRRKRKNAKV
jgi:hypothetical protein